MLRRRRRRSCLHREHAWLFACVVCFFTSDVFDYIPGCVLLEQGGGAAAMLERRAPETLLTCEVNNIIGTRQDDYNAQSYGMTVCLIW